MTSKIFYYYLLIISYLCLEHADICNPVEMRKIGSIASGKNLTNVK